ncbi:unnamed protein product [Zymoseptoria tritici ST99CH_1A5]|nr:unnamed protein product [Zymoseptoria tritici ST99CH_1E4]SMR49686.1 unnamed protein product [Zymoseptoria tritici ST99CH_3D1]SMY22383.1 unnamed protein product [Zymoseptoria tritici ST99CH_1A5]
MEIANPHFTRTLNALTQGASFDPNKLRLHRRETDMTASHADVPGTLAHSKSHTSSNWSFQSSNRSSNTTQGTSHSTLFPPPPMPQNAANHGDVVPTANIMNSVADASSSLFQICVALRQRLLGVPGFKETLETVEGEADDDTDPVTLLWRTFRRGEPLLLLYNAFQPATPLVLREDLKEDKRGKAATYKFLSACMNDPNLPTDDSFIINDLYGDDTTGFVKVARLVNRVLDILVAQGLIEDVRPTASDFEHAEKGLKRTQRQHIIAELVKSERTYVQHLELLQAFKHLVEEKGVIPGDAIHDIFLNLNGLLDFQRRFLIRVEQTNAMPEEEQNWGKLFILYCEAFKVYEPYIANQRKCEKTVIAEFGKLKDAGGSNEMRQMVESPTALHSFLMKPFQRLTKYPLLLDQLYKKGDLDDERKQDLLNGMEASTSVLTRTNEAVDREEKLEAVEELKTRVEDWKGHSVAQFGELLLYGTFTVLKSENLANGKDGERQYHVYLFETILLCIKNIDITKAKNKFNKSLLDNKGKPKLQLKGRIFMQNVTDLVSLAKPGSYTCQIFWKGDPSIENFIIRFTTEDALKKWASSIETQRRRYHDRISGTSRTVPEFSYMANQGELQNPYAQEGEDDDDDEDDDVDTALARSHTGWSGQTYFSQSRNGSSSSLRSRSTTGESSAQGPASASTGRAPALRMPHSSMPQPPLSLRTRELQQAAQSPTGGPSDSYFSPTVSDSPMSSRTSTSSGMYPFPRQQLPQNGYYEDGHGHTRFTAPAMPRAPNGQANGYGPGARAPSARPGYPPGPGGMHSAQPQLGPRHRSASSPDVHNGQRPLQRVGPQPPVPEMPAGFQNPNRSHSNSPSINNGVPGRGSPQMLRERQYSNAESSPTDYNPQRPSMSSSQFSSTRTVTPMTSRGPSMQSQAPSEPSSSSSGHPPAQLKVKVVCPSAAQTLTLVVSSTISYQTLKDRIDAKLQRSTNLTLGIASKENQVSVKLKYVDEEDFVSIQSDEDVVTAFETWREQMGEGLGGMGEIELFCQR